MFTNGTIGSTYIQSTQDASQILGETGAMIANPVNYVNSAFTNTVEAAIARSINSAVTQSRYGDIIGIVNAYNPQDQSKTEYARVSGAITNILSNTNSQNVAGETTVPPNTVVGAFSMVAVYDSATNFGSADSSQVLANVGALLIVGVSDFTSSVLTNTVEGAIANAIDTATGLNRFGDVIGITNVYKGPGNQAIKNARSSMALTNVLSNTNSQNVAGEIVAPEGTLLGLSIIAANFTNASNFGTFGDDSQLVVTEVEFASQAFPWAFSDVSVEQSIARAIVTAEGASRYGDVIGIVNAYKGPWETGYTNPRVSIAATNILSNLNSQNFAGEVVAPENDLYFSSATVTINYGTSPSAIDQLVIDNASMSAPTDSAPVLPFSNTVENATAISIRNAENAGRVGDVIGIVNAWGGRSALD